MRFHDGGPSLPHRLLKAADEGQVVWVCGAGASRARAKLPDFTGLVRSVVEDLRPLPGGMVSRLLAAEEALHRAKPPIELPPGISGLVSADRLFGLLEVEFPTPAVEAAVARALRTPTGIDLSAHEILLRLATVRGRTRLVTTNFDLLFEVAASDGLNVVLPRNLPIDFDGLVKLHGSVRGDFTGAEGDGLVLSTATFGGAYVADGWAARFMRRILERNTVVFVGYAADDPPMQYLLEALARIEGVRLNAYAFQSEGPELDRWQPRGVTAIPYSPNNGHAALWETLDAWSQRVADPSAWRSSMATMAARGPRALSPVERGQVAELVCSAEGARAFRDTGDDGPPAEWLCVFDKERRLGSPGPEAPDMDGVWDRPPLDPFDLYRLDDDPVPRAEVDKEHDTRTVPDEAWDGLVRTERDHAELGGRTDRQGRRGLTASAGPLPPRLFELAVWFGRVARQPAALWWARRQGRLHPEVMRQVSHHLSRPMIRPCDAAPVWAILVEMWEVVDQDPETLSSASARFRHETGRLGWSGTVLRRYEELGRPRLRPRRDASAVPPASGAGVGRARLVAPKIEVPAEFWRMSVPDDVLGRVVAALRRNLDRLVELLNEHPAGLFRMIPPVVRPPDRAFSRHQYERDLGGAVFGYLDKLDALRAHDRDAFDLQVASWPKAGFVFERFRIWYALGASRRTQTRPSMPSLCFRTRRFGTRTTAAIFSMPYGIGGRTSTKRSAPTSKAGSLPATFAVGSAKARTNTPSGAPMPSSMLCAG